MGRIHFALLGSKDVGETPASGGQSHALMSAEERCPDWVFVSGPLASPAVKRWVSLPGL